MSYASYHMLMIFCTTYQYVQPLYTIERISNISLDSVFLKIVFKVYITHSNSWCDCRQPGQRQPFLLLASSFFFAHTLPVCQFFADLQQLLKDYQTTTTFVLINILYTM